MIINKSSYEITSQSRFVVIKIASVKELINQHL